MFTESGRVVLSVIVVVGLIFSSIIGIYSSANASTKEDRILFGVMGCLSILSLIFVSNLI